MHSILSAIPAVVIGAVLIAFCLRPVSRARLERFARRQQLEITVSNGAAVIDYLATTRRWRVGGFVAGLLISFGIGFTQRSSYNGGAGALVGWFVGALVAEWHTDSRRAEPGHRSASLVARRLTDYVPRTLVVVNAVVWAAAVALGVSVVVRTQPAEYAVIAELCAVLMVTPVVWLISRRILARPQGVWASDMVAADDALRSRSLHVLAGSALAVNGILAALIESAAQQSYHDWMPTSAGTILDLLGALVLPVLGIFAATET
jgi:hypothetical protein